MSGQGDRAEYEVGFSAILNETVRVRAASPEEAVKVAIEAIQGFRGKQEIHWTAELVEGVDGDDGDFGVLGFCEACKSPLLEGRDEGRSDGEVDLCQACWKSIGSEVDE